MRARTCAFAFTCVSVLVCACVLVHVYVCVRACANAVCLFYVWNLWKRCMCAIVQSCVCIKAKNVIETGYIECE